MISDEDVHMDPHDESTAAADTDENESKNVKGPIRKKEGKVKDKNKCKNNPNQSKFWIRCCDAKQNACYYNVRTGDSRWLPPCAVCGLAGKKWCITCRASYCQADFSQYHNETEWYLHKWSHQEPCKRDVIEKHQVYCTECGIVAATKMCTDCWDGYCTSCFKLVHRVGFLRTHKKKDYDKAVAGWMPFRTGGGSKATDYFANGTTKESTYKKPKELMNPTELHYTEGYDKFTAELAALHEEMEKLQYDLEATSYECDTLTVEVDKATKIYNKKLEIQKTLGKAGK